MKRCLRTLLCWAAAILLATTAGLTGQAYGQTSFNLHQTLQQIVLPPYTSTTPEVLSPFGLTFVPNFPDTPGAPGTGFLAVYPLNPGIEVHPPGTETEVFFYGPGIAYNVLNCSTLAWTGSGTLNAFTITRPGEINGGSTPAWAMYAYAADGTLLSSAGEGNLNYGGFYFPVGYKDFTVSSATPIARVVFCSHNGYSTYNALPLSGGTGSARRPKLVVTDTSGNVTTLQPTAGLNDGSDDGSATKGKDADSFMGTPDDNRGTVSSCGLNSSTCNLANGMSYLQFSLAGMPAAAIASAQIQVRTVVSHWGCGWPYPADPVFGLRRVTSDWNEMALTWNNQPPVDPAVIASQTVAGVAGVAPLYVENWLSFDITDLYRAWVSGAVPNYGVRISHDNAFCMNCDSAYFWTSDDGSTKLTYTGAASGNEGDPAAVSAKLEDAVYGGPVAGRQISFAMGSLSCAGTTNSTGDASCSLSPSGAGAHTITISFAGDAQYQPITITAQYTISGGVTDATPPIIVPTITGTLGSSGWYVSDVTVTWSVTDPESGIASSSGCAPATLSASASLLCTAVNGANLTAEVPLTLHIDKTPPVISAPTMSGTLGANGWYTSAVTVNWIATDPESGITTPPCSATVNGDTAGTTVTCNATNGAGLSNASSVTVKIDKSQPAISGMPAPGCSLWPPNKKMITVAAASASAGMAGLASFEVTGASNEPPNPGPDIVITGTGLLPRTVQLRADRLGNGSGRTYTITATAINGAGVIVNSTTTCIVPHDQGK